ncbi:hypothetical protein H1R20_g14749, partial [Candolleomyces eurysporus]
MEIIFLVDSITIARYLEWATKTEVNRIWSHKQNVGKFLFLTTRYAPIVAIICNFLTNFRLYWRIGNKGCMALDVIHSVMDLIAASAAEATLLLCLYALLDAKKVWFYVFMILSFAFTVTILILEATDISHQRVLSHQLLPKHWQSLGYPCYFDSSRQSPIIYGVVAYISFTRTALAALLAIATFLHRYRRSGSSMIKVIRREGGLYYLSTILLRLIDAIIRTPNMPTIIDPADAVTLAIAIYSLRVLAIPILANRLLLNMRKINENNANTLISTMLFTKTPHTRFGSTTDQMAYEFGADTSDHISVKSFDIPLGALQAQHPNKRLVIGVAVANLVRLGGQSGGHHRVLLVRRAPSEDEFPNAWELPGGGAEVDADKTILDTVVRETLEETSLRVTAITKPIRGFEYSTSKGSAIQFNFLVEVEEAIEVKLNPEEHDEYAWVGLEDLEKASGPFGQESRMGVMRDVVIDAFKKLAEDPSN